MRYSIATLLREEHEVIMPLAQSVAAALAAPDNHWLTRAGWAAVRRDGLDLAARLIDHIEKEDMGLLPALEEVLDSDTDMKLSMELAASR